MEKDLSMKIGKYTFKYPIFQGGMGVRITLTNMSIASSNAGVVPVTSLIGTGGYKNPNYIKTPKSLTSEESIIRVINDIRAEVGSAPIFCNIMYALNEFDSIAKSAIKAGFNGIIAGAGAPISLPGLVKNNPEVVIIPIVSTIKSFKDLMEGWKKEYGKVVIPDAIIIEGPLAGGHLGIIKPRDIFLPENQLEAQIPLIMNSMINDYGFKVPIIAAGGIMDSFDIKKMLELGCTGVQLGTAFLATEECGASDYHKELLIRSKKEDIIIGKSPARLPCRKLRNPFETFQEKITCRTNCLKTCKNGKGARKAGFCIEDSLEKGINGQDDGLYMVGDGGHKITEIITTQELVNRLISEL